MHYCVSIQQLQIPLVRLLNALCEDCNISSHNFEETSLKYGKSGRSIFFAADLVYSNYEGTITSSSLISMLSSWLLSQKNPSLNVAGESVALSKLCTFPGNTFTRETCLDLLNSQASTSTSGVHIATSFVAGIIIGAAVATSFLLLLFWYVLIV